MSPAERALANQPWKEYTAEGGRKYWSNSETKESTWEMPEVFKQALGVPSTPATPAPQTPFTPGGGYQNNTYDQGRDYRDRDYPQETPRQITYPTDPKAQSFVPASNDPDYSTPEEAEAAFTKLLRRSGVQSDWTWEQAVRATARDPQFRAIKDAKDRKAAFEKYCEDAVILEREKAKERMTKLRADFETMLKRHPEIKHYTRWKTARPILESETIFKSSNNETERRQLFEEYIIGLKRAHAEEQAAKRKNALDGLIDLLPKLNLEPYTRWNDAQGLISSTAPFQSEEKYQTLSQLDILNAFQNHMKYLERAFNDSKQEEKNRKFRKERKARDQYKSLLNELRKQGKINAGTKWSQLVPLIENDERYTNMAGLGGSSPQELFWDIIEEEDRGLRGPKNDVLDVLEDKRFELSPSSDYEEFLTLMKDDRRTANLDRDILKVIFDRLKEKRSSRREEKRDDDRQQRRAVDDLRAFMKRLEPPIAISDTYEKVRPRLMKSEEYQAVSSEDLRRTAFDKHIRRLREKEDDAERRSSRRRSVERDRRDRDRSRGERSHRSNGRRRSRSPEVDAYEADRRKAIAERERQHRKSTMAESFLADDRGRLSPPPRRERERERDRDRGRDRYDDYDRPPRSRRDDSLHHDRERRERDDERERLYRRRIDRGSYDGLPYGDERPSGARRRRESQDDYARKDSRDSKRQRRDRSRERTPAREATPRKKTPPPKEPSRDIRSGSEEGEIEEEE